MIARTLERLQQDRAARIVLGAVLAYTLLYWVPASPLPDRMPWGVITQGVIFGTSYALLAMGLAIVAGPAWWTVLLLVAMGGVSGGAMAIPALAAFLFPSRLLSSAIGVGVLISRIGATIAPLIGGAMLQAGATPGQVLLAAAVPAAVCALAFLALPGALAVRKRQEAMA